MDPSKRVYDEEDQSIGSGYGESSPLDKAKSQEAKGSLFKPDGSDKKEASSSKGLSDTAKSIASAVSGPGGIASTAASLGKKSLSWVKTNKKKTVGIGGSIGALITLIIMAFFAIIPLKIEHIVSNLQKRYFASSEEAMGNVGNNLFSSYITQKVLPGYNKCGTTVSRKCVAVVNKSSTNPVSRLYVAWSDNKLENKLASQGIEFEKKGPNWRIKYPDVNLGNGVDIGPDGRMLDKELSSRKEMRAAVKDSLKNETRWKKVWYRYRVGRLLETKYGIKRCIVFCGARDSFADRKAERKLAAKIYLVERVITPRNANAAIVFKCILSGSCEDKLKDEPTDPSTDPATEGEPKSELETETRASMQSKSTEFGDLDKQKQMRDEIDKDGFKKWLAKQILGDILGETAAKISSKVVPIVGWVDLANTVVKTAKNADNTYKKLIYLTNAPAAVSLYMQYRTYSDEVHTGNKNATEVGSFVSSLGPNSQNSNFYTKSTSNSKKTISQLSVSESKDEIKGGIAGAEQSPLYGALMGVSSSSRSAFINPLSPSAYAAAAKPSKNYTCEDGKSLTQGELICPEEKLGQGSGGLKTLSGVMNSPWLAPLVLPLELYDNTVGVVVRGVGGLLGEGMSKVFSAIDSTCSLGAFSPFAPYCLVKDPISNAIKDLAETLTNALIPNPFGANMSGGRTFNMMAAGANVSGNDACAQMGCGEVPKKTVADIINNNQKDEAEKFKKRPVFARLFDTNSDFSLVSRIAMATPIEYQSTAQSSFANIMSNPLGGLFSAFGNLFSYRHGFAAANEDTVDVFNIGTFGFNSSEIPKDPEAYWEQNNCTESIKKWQEEAANTSNPTTGMPLHKKPNACLLIKNAVANYGGALDSSLLSDDDKKHLGSSTTSTTETAGANVDMANLYKDSSGIACAANTKDLGLQDGYHAGQKMRIRICAVPNLKSSGSESNGQFGVTGANGAAVVNSRVSGSVYAMVEAAKKDGVTLEANSSFRSMAHQQQLCNNDAGCRSGNYTMVGKPGTSNHQAGIAIDFSEGGSTISKGTRSWNWLNSNASKFSYKPYSAEAWHWSPSGN